MMPRWRNWQTRWTQNPLIERSCGFDPHSGYHLTLDFKGIGLKFADFNVPIDEIKRSLMI
jgi:hypothetical protein